MNSDNNKLVTVYHEMPENCKEIIETKLIKIKEKTIKK